MWTDLQLHEPAVPLCMGPLEPFEGPVHLATGRVRVRNLDGSLRRVGRDQIMKCRVRLRPVAQGMVKDRKRPEAELLLGLPLGFCQCLPRSGPARAASWTGSHA